MKKFFSIWVFTCATFFPSCNKYLETNPDNRLELNSVDKVARILGSAYPAGDYISFSESMSDNAADREVVGDQISGDPRINLNAYRYIDYASTAMGSPDVYWQGCYRAIAAANQALEAIGAAGESTAYRPYKGEALLARAYAHFMLVTFFAKCYDPETAGSDPGIPYLVSPEKQVNPSYDRKTVKYVYDQIEKDITEGLPLISNSAYKMPPFHFNKAAACAFASRFYLFKKDYSKTASYAEQAIPGNEQVAYLRPLNTTFNEMTGEERWAAYTSPLTKSNLLLAQVNSIWARGFVGFQFGMTQEIAIQLYYSNNIVNGEIAYNCFYFGTNTNKQGFQKWLEHFVYTGENIGYPYLYVPLFTAEEVLFNHAEASANLGNFPLAIKYLNDYYSTRVVNYNPANHALTIEKITSYYNMPDNPRKALVMAILHARRCEFAQEGIRWLDILRHKLPVSHTEKNGVTHKLTEDDPRKMLQIPQEAQQVGISPNPR